MNPAALRSCPTCHQDWPGGDEYDLRSFAWLDNLPRGISPSNGDIFLHDGYHGADRFLFVETKMPSEPPLAKGQQQLLTALARVPNFDVALIKGTTARFVYNPVGSEHCRPGILTNATDFRRAVIDFLNGEPFRVRP